MNFQKKNKTFIIAEAGVNHNGSFKQAKKLIDISKESGADAVKFQTYNVREHYNPKYVKKSKIKWASKFVLQFSEILKLKKYCEKKKITFLSSPFDPQSAKFLNKIGMSIFKIASANVYNFNLLKTISSFKKPVIISSGYSDINQLKKIKKYFNKKMLSVLYCISEYPTKINSINLNEIKNLKKKLNCQVGYSDHYPGIEFAVLAKAYGAKIIEKHIKISDRHNCPDEKISADPKNFKLMVNIIRNLEKKNKKKIIKKSNLGIYLSVDLKKNDKITMQKISYLKPWYNLNAKNFLNLIGKKAKLNLNKYDKIKFSNFKK